MFCDKCFDHFLLKNVALCLIICSPGFVQSCIHKRKSYPCIFISLFSAWNLMKTVFEYMGRADTEVAIETFILILCYTRLLWLRSSTYRLLFFFNRSFCFLVSSLGISFQNDSSFLYSYLDVLNFEFILVSITKSQLTTIHSTVSVFAPFPILPYPSQTCLL